MEKFGCIFGGVVSLITALFGGYQMYVEIKADASLGYIVTDIVLIVIGTLFATLFFSLAATRVEPESRKTSAFEQNGEIPTSKRI